ncbi:MAG: efflux RND transporter periplasmic adaptor subunit, partial [Deltaproteobacteria bacterium]|nr:efflux RND transporter periplasmic adaptor subunit [Deltaproteobacteria bacterium]
NIFIILLIVFFTISGCQKEQKAREKKPRNLPTVKVDVVTATVIEIPFLNEVMGTVQPVNRAAIAAKITGTIEKIPVSLGSAVSRGDLLVEISAEEISAKVIQAQAQLAQAKRNLNRERKLLQKKAATSESVKSLQDMYRVAEAVYREAKTMLGYTKINAPFDGLITKKIANVGDLSTPGTPLLQLENNTKLQVVTSIPEGIILQIKEGDQLPVTIPAGDLSLTGTVAEIAPASDPFSRTTPIKINIENNSNLRSGQFARVALPGKNIGTLFVPASAVLTSGQMEKIFVADGGKAHLRLVRTGRHEADRIEILAGLNPGDKVIIDNNKFLLDGQPLNIN